MGPCSRGPWDSEVTCSRETTRPTSTRKDGASAVPWILMGMTEPESLRLEQRIDDLEEEGFPSARHLGDLCLHTELSPEIDPPVHEAVRYLRAGLPLPAPGTKDSESTSLPSRAGTSPACPRALAPPGAPIGAASCRFPPHSSYPVARAILLALLAHQVGAPARWHTACSAPSRGFAAARDPDEPRRA
jgi:hypothetical protein